MGGAGLLGIAIYGASEGRLPLKGSFGDPLELSESPEFFGAYAIALGAIGAFAILWGLFRRS